MSGTWWRRALGDGREPSRDQQAAITAPADGWRSVDAGAGTGKTSTLALRALYLIASGGLRPDEIVVITFTNKAAAEVGARIADALDRANGAGAALATGRGVHCTTIHGLAAAVAADFALTFGFAGTPRPIADGEAYAVFADAFRALLARDPSPDTQVLPLAEVNPAILERDLGKLALRLKNLGVTPAAFAARAHGQADALRVQSWGQLWSARADRNSERRKELEPRTPVTPEERAREAEREHALIRVVRDLFADFDRRLDERSALTYGDLIGRTTALLRARPVVVAQLRARWRYVLLDESQDTSDLQLAFIETLFGAPGEAGAAGLMPVGDVRQAIYGFNGADEFVMQRLTAASDSTHALIVNRRSHQEIVDAGHAVLAAAKIVTAEAPRLHAAAGSGGLDCVRIETFGTDGETVKEHVAAEAAAIAREVARLTAVEETRPSDIAILIRRRTHAAAYVRALNERGIAAALDRRSGLFAADEIRDALAWIALLVDVRDRQAAVRILQSPLCGLNDATLIALTAHDDWLARLLVATPMTGIDADARPRIEAMRRLLVGLLPAVALPLPTAIAHLLAAVPLAAGYAQLGAAIGAQAVANLRGFEELVGAFAAQRPNARLRDLLDDVRRRILYDDEPQEAELDLDGVRVLTVHQAKGLEWPYVFVAGATRAQYAHAEPTDRVVGFDPHTGAFGLKNDVDGRETLRWLMLKTEHDPLTGERVAAPRRKLTAEREAARIFYVAVTRAKRRVYITAPCPPNRPGACAHVNAIAQWAQAQQPEVDLRFDTAPDPAAASADVTHSVPRCNGAQRSPTPPIAREPVALAFDFGSAARPSAELPRPRISFSAIAAFQTCPRMARYRYRLLLPALREPQPRFVGVEGTGVAADAAAGRNAARRGSLAHRALEIWGRAAIDGRPIGTDAACDDAQRQYADLTVEESVRARACVERAVAALAGYTLVAVEMAFSMTFAAARVDGAIDLVARDPAGRLTVIDYKTGRANDALNALQLALYRAVAAQQYRERDVAAVILRLTPDAAAFSTPAALDAVDLAAIVAQAGTLESDVARVGEWCGMCVYRASPCRAPMMHAG